MNIEHTTFQVPKDYDRFPEFRRLESALTQKLSKSSGHILASYLFLKLWTDLAYQAALNPLGCIPKDEWEFFYRSLNIDATKLDAETLLSLFKTSGYLQEQDQFYFCMVFFMHNEELSKEFRRAQVKATEAAALKRNKERFAKNAGKDIRKIPEQYFVVDNKPIDPAERNRIVVVVRIIDSILGTAERDTNEFGIGLIQDACRMVRRFSVEQIDSIMHRLMAKRRTQGLPRSTEKFVADLENSLIKIAPEQGWGEWSKILTHQNIIAR